MPRSHRSRTASTASRGGSGPHRREPVRSGYANDLEADLSYVGRVFLPNRAMVPRDVHPEEQCGSGCGDPPTRWALPQPIGEKLLLGLVHYDSVRLATSLASINLPVMAIQSTYSDEQRVRRSMSEGQTTPYLNMLRANVPSARVEIIADTGHFPQIDDATQVNELLDKFLASLGAGVRA